MSPEPHEPHRPGPGRSLSGRQLEIVSGGSRAVVTEVGAGLRTFTVDGLEILDGYAEEEMSPAGHGQVLMPWPNRLEDGEYEFAGRHARAALDEPAARNAIHGLARWHSWELARDGEDTVRARTDLPPQPGYPFTIRLGLTYTVGPDGTLGIEATALNIGPEGSRAPFGAGFHPYLAAGPGGVDGATLRLEATTRLVPDGRGIPRSKEPVAGTSKDFASGRPLAGIRLDDCFTGLPARWSAVLERSDGRALELWADASFPYVMCFTGDTLDPERRRAALAVEPMTCPPNSFRSGEALVVLEPGREWSGRFGIRLSRR